MMKKMFEDKFANSVAQVVNVTQDNDVIIMMMTTSECKDVDEFMFMFVIVLDGADPIPPFLTWS